MAEFTTKQEVGFNVDNQHAVMNGIRKAPPLRRGDVYIANVPWSFTEKREG